MSIKKHSTTAVLANSLRAGEDVLLATASRPPALKNPEVLRTIIRMIFSGGKKEFQERRFKFDISFGLSRDYYSRVRFSYNDFGERARMRKAIPRIMELCEFDPSLISLSRAFFVKNLPVTFGIDWPKHETYPRIKVYFEITRNSNPLLKDLCLKSGFPYKSAQYFLGSRRLCAVGLTFFRRRSCQVKIYSYNGKEAVFSFLTRKQSKETAYFIDYFSHLPCGFLLNCLTFTQEGQLLNAKYYSMYPGTIEKDVSSFSREAAQRNLQIFTFLRRYSMHDRYDSLLGDLSCIASGRDAYVYPVSLSLGLPVGLHKNIEWGAYFSFCSLQ